jgi:hypothetical protein
MPTFARQLSLALVVLLLWIVAALAAQFWLRNETTRMLKEAVAVKTGQFDRSIELLPPHENRWDPASLHELGLILGVEIELRDGPPPSPAVPGLTGSFDRTIPDDADRHLHV